MILIFAGIIGGFLNIMAGGGSLLTLPAMVLLGIEGAVANGTNRIAILAQNITATLTFASKGLSEWKLSLLFSCCALPGAIIGAYYGTKLQGIWFNRVLAIVMFLMMFALSSPSKKIPTVSESEEKDKLEDLSTDAPKLPPLPPFSRKRLGIAAFLIFLAGFYGGFIQVGVGFLFMAILHRVLGLDLVRVNMYKVFIIGVYTVAALFIFAWKNQVFWGIGLSLAFGNAIGGWLGSHYSIKKGEAMIRKFLNGVLLVLILKLLFF